MVKNEMFGGFIYLNSVINPVSELNSLLLQDGVDKFEVWLLDVVNYFENSHLCRSFLFELFLGYELGFLLNSAG